MTLLDRLLGRSGPTEPPPPFPFPLEAVPGRDAPARLAALRAEGAAQGFWPLLIGGRDEIDRIREVAEGFGDPAAPTVDSIIAAAQQFDVDRWFRDRTGDEEEMPALHEPAALPLESSTDHLALSSHLETLSRKPKKEVFFCRVPTRDPAAVFAFLRTGGWNACPNPEEHVAIARRWHSRFGAEVVAHTSDVIEYFVARPPTSDADALALAREQYLYCGDIVDQGTESIAALASMLKGSNHWWFWWD